MDALRLELRNSVSLLFSRDQKSRRLAQVLFTGKSRFQFFNKWRGKPVGEVASRLPYEFQYTQDAGVHLRDYRVFRPHLAYLRERMKAWKPRTFQELFIPGYYDRLTWFTAIFGLVFGIIGTLSLVASVVQIWLTVVGLNAIR